MHTGGPNGPRAEQHEGEGSLHVSPAEVAGITLPIDMDLFFLQIIPLKSIARSLAPLERGPMEAGLEAEAGTT